MDAQQIQKVATDWLTQRTGGAWSDEDQARFDAWINESLAHRIAYIRVESVWNEIGRLQAVGASVARGVVPARGLPLRWVPPASDDIARAVAESRSVVTAHRWLAPVAAGFVLLAVAVGLYISGIFPPSRYTTKVGDIDTLTLDDGSDVILNTDTRIRVEMKPEMRRVELSQGEAFFKVAKDAARPFIVDVSDKRVVAVGTQFSVRHDGQEIQVIVTEGAVLLKHQRAEPSSNLLKAGSVAHMQRDKVLVEQRPEPQIEESLSWRQGYLVFRDSPLVEAVAEFNRYNTRKIVIDDPSIARIQIGGHFRATSTEVFLWMLKNGFPVKVEESERGVVLKRR